MPFRPNAHDKVTIGDTAYVIAVDPDHRQQCCRRITEACWCYRLAKNCLRRSAWLPGWLVGWDYNRHP
ncbi:MAG: hypothetical protein JW892_04325 [Anaerolineae bacterium]|nr:hypothetical protein [Anaerolineae bacterium]